ncbi:MAG: arginine--tRNA ligase [bacterium]
MEIQNQLRTLMEQALASLQLPPTPLTFDLPPDLTHGDFASSIALRLTKVAGKPPLQLAEEIAGAIPPNDLIEKIEVLKPGFVNLFIRPAKLLEIRNLKLEIGVRERVCVEYTDPNPFKEFHIGHLYSNVVGECLARLQEAIGHDVYRLCYQGDVGMHVANSVYGMIEGPNPVSSRQSIVDSEKQTDPSSRLVACGSLSLSERVKWLGQCYAFGATENKEKPEVSAKVKLLNAQIFQIAQEMWQKTDPTFVPQIDYAQFVKAEAYPHDLVYECYVTGRAWTMEYFENVYQTLGTHSQKSDAEGAFDHYYAESKVAEYGYTTVMKHLETGLFEKSEGAIVSSKEKNGLHTRVFINSHGLPTYEAKELGLNPEKYKKYHFDRSIIVTANEINEYFKVLLWNLKQIDAYVGEHTTHIGHGVVQLPEGKMSSRTGKIISGESLIEEATSRVIEKMEQTRDVIARSDAGTTWQSSLEPGSFSKEEEGVIPPGVAYGRSPAPPAVIPAKAGIPNADIAQKIAIAAIKYSLLKTNIGKDVVFSFDESLSFEGNSGPYLLYTVVRCKSILGKSTVNSRQSTALDPVILPARQIGGSEAERSRKISSPTFSQFPIINSPLSIINYPPEDLLLLRLLARYNTVIAESARLLSPHAVCTYLYTLASEFSSYYAKVNILKTEDAELRETRLRLVSYVADTLTRGCQVLGFEVVERM